MSIDENQEARVLTRASTTHRHNDADTDWNVLSSFGSRSSKPLCDIRLISSQELLERSIEPRRFLLEPWLRQKDVVLLYARRGIGKTLFGMSVAYAVAAGSEFLRFKASEARRVLYIDGEMPLEMMRERLAAIEKGSSRKVAPDFLQFLCADDIDGPMLDLGLGLNQRELEPHLKDFVSSLSITSQPS